MCDYSLAIAKNILNINFSEKKMFQEGQYVSSENI